jgi:Flp pilus assembly protein TadG
MRRARQDRGAAAVEFALVLPVLLLIIFGIIDFGRMLYTQITLTQAAQASARAAAILGQNPGVTEANTAASGLNATPGQLNVTVTPCPDPPDPTANAEADLTYNFVFVTPLSALANLGGNNVTLTAKGFSPCVG